MTQLYTTFQQHWVTPNQNMDILTSNATVVVQSGRNFSEHKILIIYELRKIGIAEGTDPSDDETLQAPNASKEVYAATCFLCSLNK